MTCKFITMIAVTTALMLSNPADAQKKGNANSSGSAVAAMFSDRTAETEARFPWHYKTDWVVRFKSTNRVADSTEEKQARSAFGWQTISRRLLTQKTMFPKFILYLGITDTGMLEGVVFGSVFSAMAGDKAAIAQLSEFQSVTISPLGIDGLAEMPLEPIQSASVPGKDYKLWFRKFKPGNKANRMLGALPDDSEIRIFHTISGKEGSTNYWIQNKPVLTAFTIGYLKEMSKTIRESKKP